MKRESKVYSFKEQQEELQLRRELYEKRKKEGKIKEPKLTPKQEEILKTQMAKESTIRKRLTELKLKIDNVISLTICSMHGNGQELSFYLKDLLPPILKNLESPLAAPAMSDLYIRLKEIIKINNPVLSNVVAHVTLRQLQPQCDLNHAWEEENLDSAVKRTLNLLHTTAIKQKKLFTAPTFCYIFPFIKKLYYPIKMII
uniref:Translational activator GCN1 n=1 Tax=Apis cerana TaxID=7461 RepID=V9IMM5_APICE